MSRRAAILLGCAIYLGVILFARLPDRLILFPTTAALDARGATRKTISFEKGELEFWVARSRLARQKGHGHADIYVLRFYGNADRAERWPALEADSWGERAIEIWGMNYPGYGGSTGPASLARMARAGVAGFDALQSEAAGKPIVIFAASIGSCVALYIAVERAVNGLVLHNPPPLRQMILRRFGWWNLWLLAGPVALQIPAELDSVANAKRAKSRAIFLLAENDEVVPPKFQRLVVDAFAGEKHIVNLPGASHNSPIEGRSVAQIKTEYDWLLAR